MMKLLTIIISAGLFLVSSVEATRSTEGRIAGGELTDTIKVPYIVSINMKYKNSNGLKNQTCGGSIIADNWILTAAHCNIDDENKLIRAGSSFTDKDGITAKVLQVIPHKDYNADTLDNDIALMKLDRSITGPNGGKIIQMTSQDQPILTGQVVRVSGWGLIKYSTEYSYEPLGTVEVAVTDHAACNTAYTGLGHTITDNMVCARSAGKDACSMDSGGPMVVDENLLIGVVSHGYECALENYPGVYTKIANYRKWIKDNSGI